jgi:hypothetical protein
MKKQGDQPKSWGSRISRPFSGVSLPAIRIPGRGKDDDAVSGDKTSGG